ncbi:MAG: hypothetical protein QI197_07180 [Candidatus Korarchaeota archaeon]|nr:hypothetical protein [Candidatus Korarchaeota archaeon]
MEAREPKIDIGGAILDLNVLRDEYGIRTDLTHQVKVEGLDGRLTRLMKVMIPDFNVYLLETPYILRYISHPHIAGESLEVLLSENSSLLKRIVGRFTLQRFGRIVAAESLVRKMGLDIPLLDDLRDLSDVVAIVATPISRERVEVLESSIREKGGRLRVILFLGPLSWDDMNILGDEANSLGVDSIFLSPALLGSRDSRGALVAYGIDIGLLRRGKVVELGSVVDKITLCRLLKDYPPGIDMSGLRERIQPDLNYLRSILEDILFLLEQPVFDPWQIEILMREAKNLRRQLMRYGG